MHGHGRHAHGHHPHHDHDHEHGHDHGDAAHIHGPGHNHSHAPRTPAQWQTPHQLGTLGATVSEPDLDKVEQAFVEGFLSAADPASFLRLARIPFEITTDGMVLRLLRVEINALTDVGSLTPHLGGESFRYDPLPTTMVSRRQRLSFVYFDGARLRSLGFSDARRCGSDT